MIGPPGIPGSRGPQGPAGKTSFSYLALAWQIPALGTVAITHVTDTSWMIAGTLVYIPGAGTFTVIGAPTDSQTVNLANSGDPSNQPAGIMVQSGTLISPASQRGPTGPQGIAGPAGPIGPQGASGTSANSVTTQVFAVPATGQQAVCFVQTASNFGIGQIVFVAGGDYMSVQNVNATNNTITLQNMGLLGTAAGTNIPVGATVSGTGPQGPQGIPGPQGPAGPQGLIGVAPTGAIFAYGAKTAPGGYLVCDGTAYSTSTYSTLFSIIGTSYNVGGEAAGTFRVPNLSGRFPLGASATHPQTPSAQSGGSETHTMALAELAAHTHHLTDPGHTHTDSGHTHIQNAHAHSITDQLHSHGISPNPHNHTLHDPQHSHGIVNVTGAQGSQPGAGQYSASGGTQTNPAATGIYIDAVTLSIANAYSGINTTVAATASNNAASANIAAHSINITNTDSTGSASPMSIMPPFQVVQYIIKT
jgi:microcystin-dependent protein